MADETDGRSMDEGKSIVDATRKSLDILQYLREEGPATLSEIAEDVGLAKSTVFRHLRTLEGAGHIAQYDDEYYLGQLYLDYGIHAQRSHPLYHAAKPKVDALAEQVGEKVWCAVEENGFVVHLYFKSGRELYRSFTRLGYRGHLHAFSSGKAILAHLPPERIDEIIATRGLPAYTEDTITDEEELLAELETVRERGLAVHINEAVSGSNAVSVPILRDDGSPVGSICVAGPASRLDESRLYGDIADRLHGLKNEIEISLKYDQSSGNIPTEPSHRIQESEM